MPALPDLDPKRHPAGGDFGPRGPAFKAAGTHFFSRRGAVAARFRLRPERRARDAMEEDRSRCRRRSAGQRHDKTPALAAERRPNADIRPPAPVTYSPRARAY